MLDGGVPRRAGHHRRTCSWFPPIPPLAITTAGARSSKSPAGSRLEPTPRPASSGARTVPWTPATAPPSRMRPSTRWRKWKVSAPSRAAARALSAKGSEMPVPVPHGTWNRGTELPWPAAVPLPRSAQPTSGVNLTPCSSSQDRFAPAANSTYARPHRTAHSSSGRSPSSRSQPADPCQSCQARSSESFTPRRRCMGLSTRKIPPKDQNAWPPRLRAFSCSTIATLLPARTSSLLATSPARPAPMMMTSVSMTGSAPLSAGPGRTGRLPRLRLPGTLLLPGTGTGRGLLRGGLLGRGLLRGLALRGLP